MASSLTLKIGAFTATRNADATDAQVTEVLKRFAWATGAPQTATNAELGQHVLAEWMRYAVAVARQQKQAEAAAQTDTTDIGF